MGLIVQKFGGTSLANAKLFHRAAGRCINAKMDGNQVIVVVSAMGESTDTLIDLASQITDQLSRMDEERFSQGLWPL